MTSEKFNGIGMRHDYRWTPMRIPWPPILLLGSVLLAVLLGQLAPLTWPGLDDRPAQAIGLTIGAMGLGLIFWAAWVLHRAHTTILPHRGADRLVTSGPYARFRNPIYLGEVMVLLGTAEVTKNIWFVVIAALFAFLIYRLAILPEEHHLAMRFGKVYDDYKKRSRLWI
ncbi:MAG: methyltransferase family protein [Hyphomicrobiaceae bacterium]